MLFPSFKKMLMVATAAFIVTSATADSITREQAQQRAESYLSSLPGRQRAPRLTPVTDHRRLAPQRKRLTLNSPDLYYVFNLGEGEGFIIATADDSTDPVLGYCDEGEFDYATLPENMKWWLGWMTSQLQELADNPVSEAKRAPRRAAAHPAVATLCTSKWNQGDPYNQECPKYSNGERCVTGCVATAMAQILYFHRDRSVDEIQKRIPGYTHDGMTIAEVPAESPIDWDNMIDTYSGSSTGKQKTAVAQLMRYCGVGVEMMYGIGANGGSAAYSYKVVDALKNYFGYGSSVKYVSTDNPGSDSWDATLYKEVAAGRPCYLSGSNSDGGHAFVCDGYDGDQCFHINWGWGGASDGYYMLSKLNPGSQGIGGSSGGYSGGPEAVIGIEPEFFAEKAISFSDATVKKLAVAAWDADGDGKLTFGEAAQVTELGDIFKGQAIKTCAELYHFTALKTIGADAFAGCTKLTTVKLPKSLTTIGDRAFQGCTALKTFKIPDNVTAIGDEAFAGCSALTGLELPATFAKIGARAFQNCNAIAAFTLPFSLATLGDGAFEGCTKLQTVAVTTPMPDGITLGSGVFTGMDLTSATLQVRQGTRAYFAATDQWRDFGKIQEQRDRSRSTFATLEADQTYYLYNVGTGLYLSRGEAWETQAIVDEEPMRFTLKHTAAMGDNVYALYSDDTGKSSHYTFRTTTDSNVGNGIPAAFVDGNLNSNAYWQFAEVQSGVYTIQIPKTANDFVSADQFWGVQLDHESNFAEPTYGVYSDIAYADHPQGCQWRLVAYDADFAALYQASQSLLALIEKANKQKIITQREQAVYDNMESSQADIEAAQTRLRHRLGIIDFADQTVRNTAVENWDTDGDGEMTEAEAAAVTELETIFSASDVATLADMQYFTGVTRLVNNAFQNCKQLTEAVLPPNLTTIGYRVFKNCSALESVTLGSHVQTIGVSAFEGCTALKTVRVEVADPAAIRVPASAFKNVDLAAATLYVPFGCREAYAQADVWMNFGTIREMRTHIMPVFSPVAVNTPGYIFHIGTGRYIAPGEAYGTQAVVAQDGIVYQFKRSNSMAAGTYYLSSDQTGQTNKILFRTSTDTKVGDGVKACFVDGTLSAKAYWKLEQAEDNTFTLQVPAKDATYVEGDYLGIDPSHDSKAASPTYGLYWDISGDGTDSACRWAFITEEDFQKAQDMNAASDELGVLLAKAAARSIDATAEQAVYDDAAATYEDIAGAVGSLQRKLHLIAFQSDVAKDLCIALWDTDDDYELSYEEAAAVTDIAESFRGKTTIYSLEELRYFTGLTAIPANAFRSCTGIQSIYVPAGVKEIGADAFTSMSKLKYMAVLPTEKVDAAAAGLPKSLTVFVPAAQMEAYTADETWGSRTIMEYTGIPTVTADDQERQQGRANRKFTYVVTGAPINGTPVLTCEAITSSPAGTYPINVMPGTITSEGLVCVPGTLTILDPDGVRDLQMVNGKWSNGKYYDLSGRQIVNGKSVNGKLPRGVYIRNGKKMVK